MARLSGFPEDTFAAMAKIRETTLARFDSLFTPERQIWTLQHLRRFHALFVERFEEGEGTFLEKFRRQLEGADDEVFQFAGELLYVQQFFTSLAGPERSSRTCGLSSRACRANPRMGRRRSEARARGGPSFNQHRPYGLAWLNEFLIHWHGLPEGDRVRLLLRQPRQASTTSGGTVVYSNRSEAAPSQLGYRSGDTDHVLWDASWPEADPRADQDPTIERQSRAARRDRAIDTFLAVRPPDGLYGLTPAEPGGRLSGIAR